jgi:hypothetical protein
MTGGGGGVLERLSVGENEEGKGRLSPTEGVRIAARDGMAGFEADRAGHATTTGTRACCIDASANVVLP